MKCEFYVSGTVSYRKRLEEKGIKDFNELISYAEFAPKKNCFEKINELCEVRSKLMIDSGAFTVFQTGNVIEMKDFIDWHKRLAAECPSPKITLRAGLDAIGDWAASKQNQILCDEAGIDVFPTWHGEDPESYLEWILERGYKQMALGGVAKMQLTAHNIAKVLDIAFAKIYAKHSTIQTHLFGVTNVEIIKQYPINSCDSSSPTPTGNFGSIMIPKFNPFTEDFEWLEPMIRISISNENNRRGFTDQHFTTLNKGTKQAVEKFIKDWGFTAEGLTEDHRERKCLCLLMHLEQAKHYPELEGFQLPKKEFDFLAVA